MFTGEIYRGKNRLAVQVGKYLPDGLDQLKIKQLDQWGDNEGKKTK